MNEKRKKITKLSLNYANELLENFLNRSGMFPDRPCLIGMPEVFASKNMVPLAFPRQKHPIWAGYSSVVYHIIVIHAEAQSTVTNSTTFVVPSQANAFN